MSFVDFQQQLSTQQPPSNQQFSIFFAFYVNGHISFRIRSDEVLYISLIVYSWGKYLPQGILQYIIVLILFSTYDFSGTGRCGRWFSEPICCNCT
jgi:transcriptional regulatory protein LevR